MSFPTIIIIIIINSNNNNNNNIGIPYLPWAVFIALVLVGPSKGPESQQAGGKPVGYLQAWSRI